MNAASVVNYCSLPVKKTSPTEREREGGGGGGGGESERE